MVSTLDSLKHFINNGVIPSCYREMRKIIENLAWVMFDDILAFNVSDFHWVFRPYFDIPKEWYNLGLKRSKLTEFDLARKKLRSL